MPSATRELMTPEAFAAALGKGRRAVYAMIEAGEVHAEDHRSPGADKPKYRIPASELKRWRQMRRTKAVRRQAATIRVPTKDGVADVQELIV